MKTPLAVACALALCSLALADAPTITVPASAATPTPTVAGPTKESIDKLLMAMDVQSLISNMQARVNLAVKTGMQASLRGQVATPEQQKIVDNLAAKVSAAVTSQLSWENMKPLYTQVYSETFTQEEIDGLTAFYQTPTGKVFISKVPQVMDRTTALMQARLQPLMRQLQMDMMESSKQIQALRPKPTPTPTTPVAAAVLAPVAAPTAAPKN
jgi:hypothetical protein